MSYLVQLVEDGSLPSQHQWAVGQWCGGNGHSADTVAFIERSAVCPHILSECWVAAQGLLA